MELARLFPFSLCIQYARLGQPVIKFSGFDGQVTNVQLWDYPLSYKEILRYMNSDMFGYVCMAAWASSAQTEVTEGKIADKQLQTFVQL